MDGPETAEPPPPQAEPDSPASSQTCQIALEDPRSLLSAPDAAWVTESLGRALALLGLSGEVRVRLVDDERMTQEHGQALDDWTTTDVLTFDMREQAGDPLDTDLFLCVDEAKRQGELRGHSVRDELLLYALHGVLHCVGYDDHDDEDFAAMHAKEDELLRAIGVGPRYASDSPGLER